MTLIPRNVVPKNKKVKRKVAKKTHALHGVLILRKMGFNAARHARTHPPDPANHTVILFFFSFLLSSHRRVRLDISDRFFDNGTGANKKIEH